MNYQFNPHSVGIIMKETTRRVIVELRRQRFTFEAKKKTTSYSNDEDDLITTADHAAQKIILHMLKQNFPGVGIIAEEDFACEPENGSTVYITVDPLDGTKAFGRRQSDGTSTMMSWTENGKLEGAWIGDANTFEFYYTRPGSEKVHRLSDLETSEKLVATDKRLLKMPALFKKDPRRYTKFIQEMTHPLTGCVKGVDISTGSIGLMFSKLWKEEAGMLIMAPQAKTPWDLNPCYCISAKLGYKFFRIVSGKLVPFEPKPVLQVQEEEYETLVIHESRINELQRNL